MATIRKPKNLKGLSNKVYLERIDTMKEMYEDYLKQDIDELHVCISRGNTKTGEIPSVSLIPTINCGNCGACHKKCYDLRNDCCYKNVQMSRARNAAILTMDRDKYFREIEATVMINRAFRWHIGGDVVDYDYFERMVELAKKYPHCSMLAFTKMFKVVNEWIDNNGELPSNLQIIFSGWVGQEMDNKHNLPTSHPLFSDGSTSAHDGAKLCTGNCTNCFKENKLCFSLNNGEEVVFNAH